MRFLFALAAAFAVWGAGYYLAYFMEWALLVAFATGWFSALLSRTLVGVICG